MFKTDLGSVRKFEARVQTHVMLFTDFACLSEQSYLDKKKREVSCYSLHFFACVNSSSYLERICYV